MRTTIRTLASLVGIAVIATVLPAQAATPTVSAKVKAQLLYLVEEEKLARDVYAALDAVSISPKFKNPTIGKKPGVFTNKSLTTLYKTLVAKGKLSEMDAISVGILIEKKDLADLATLSKIVTQADIKFTLANLKKGSENHLAAFQR
jgi:hypothetical protein